MVLYLWMAIFWFVIGTGLIGWHWMHPEGPFLDLLGTGISIGWFALFMALYDLARWWSARSRAITRRLESVGQRSTARPAKTQEPDRRSDA